MWYFFVGFARPTGGLALNGVNKVFPAYWNEKRHNMRFRDQFVGQRDDGYIPVGWA